MADGFRSLRELLAGPAAVPAAPEPGPPPPPPALPPADPPAGRELRLFRARLADALDAATARLLAEIAYAVVGRELATGAVDLERIVARVLAEHPAARPLRLRVSPADAGLAPAGIETLADATLAPGDAIVEFADGAVDARLGVRLAALLEPPA